MTAMARLRAALAGRDGLAQICVVLAALGAYEGARLLMTPNWQVAFENARSVVSFEQVVGLAWEKSLQRLFLGVPDLVEAMNVFYFVGHFVLTGVFFAWLYHRSRPAFRLFRDSFLVATALAVVIHWRFPTAPPRLAGVGLQDTLLTLSGIDIGSPTSSALTNPVAAVPSLHAAYALGVGLGLVLYGRHPLTRIVGAVYPPLVVLTIVVTGNHFFLDAIAGVAVLGASFLVAWRFAPARRARDEQPAHACLT